MVFCPPSTWPLGAALACGLLAMTSEALRLKLFGVGAMSSPRYAHAGLLVLHSAGNVMLDGGPGAEPEPPMSAWLVTDLQAELIAQIRPLARARGLSQQCAPTKPMVWRSCRSPSRIQPPDLGISHELAGALGGLGTAILRVPRPGRAASI